MKTIKMKDSGIEWIGEIPEDWSIVKVKYILGANDGGVWGDDPTGTETDKTVIRSTEQTIDGLWSIVNPAKRNLSKFSCDKCLIKKNDLLLTKSSGSSLHIGKTTLADSYFEEHECFFSNFLQRIRLKPTQFPKFYWYIFNSVFVKEQFVYLQNSTSGIGNINSDNINNIIAPAVSYIMQQKIAEFLDEKCADIDKLIANQQGQIEKLKEYKQAIITQAVTKGLNPSAPMKDSGVEWIGEIPEGWNKSRVGLLYKIVLGKMLCPNKISDDYTLEKYYCATNVHFDSISSSDALKEMWFSNLEKELYKVNNGDLLIVEGGAGAGGCFIVSGITENIFIQNSVMIVRSRNISNTRYLKYWIENLVKRGYVDVICNKATIPHFTKDKLSNASCAVPPIEEQQQIADYLDKKCSEIDKLISIKQAKIEKLNEYKKSLIYEYVTGKKEVV